MSKFCMIGAGVVSGIFLALTAAQSGELPKFNTVGEAVGWVKAKGKCDERTRHCTIRIDLPKEEELGSGEWDVWAWLDTSEFVYRLSVRIIRSRYSDLSADKAVRVRIVKTSEYFFGKNGAIRETQVGFTIENFKGERILDFQIPTDSFMHGQGGADSVVFSELGINWIR